MNFDMDTPFRVYASVQDHGAYRAAIDLSNGRENLQPMTWEGAPGGEYTQHAVDPRNPNIVYSGKLSRTDFSIPVAPRGRGAGGRGAGAAGLPAGAMFGQSKSELSERAKTPLPPEKPGRGERGRSGVLVAKQRSGGASPPVTLPPPLESVGLL